MRKPGIGEGNGFRLGSALSVAALSAILGACGATAPKKDAEAKPGCVHASQVLAKDKFLGVMPKSRNGIAHFVIDLGATMRIERQLVVNDSTERIISDSTIPIANTTITYHEAYDGLSDTVSIAIGDDNPQHPKATVTTCFPKSNVVPAGQV
jgi:hypothetical protein